MIEVGTDCERSGSKESFRNKCYVCGCWQSWGIGKKLFKYYKQQLISVDSPSNIEYFKFDFSFVN